MIKKLKQKNIILLLIILSLLFFIVSTQLNRGVYQWDEAVYMSNAENMFSQEKYYFEDSRPMLLPMLILGFSSIFNLDISALFVIGIFFVLMVLFTYLCAKEMFDIEVALLSSLLILISPYLFHYSPSIMTEIPSASLIVLTAYLTIKKSKFSGISSGILSFLAIIMRYTSLFILPIVGLYYLLNKRIKEFWQYSATIIVSLGGFLIYSKYAYGEFLYIFLKASAVTYKTSFVYLIAYYLASLLLIIGVVGTVGLLFYFQRVKWRKILHNKEIFILILIPVFFVLMAIVAHDEIRYVLPIVPFLAILSAKGYSNLIDKIGKKYVIILLILLFVMQIPFLDFFQGKNSLGETCADFYEREDTCEDTLKKQHIATMDAALFLKENSGEEDVLYSASYYPLVGFYSKKKTAALWPYDETFYSIFPKNMPSSGYYILHKKVMKHPSEEWLASRKEFNEVYENEDVKVYSYAIS